MVMETYKRMQNAFKVNLIGSDMDTVLAAAEKLGLRLCNISEHVKYTTVQVTGDMVDEAEKYVGTVLVHMTFSPDTLILKDSRLSVNAY